MFVRTQTNGSRTYLLVVENRRINGRIQQQVLHRLGRLDKLLESGRLDALLASLGRFSQKYAVLGAHLNGDSLSVSTTKIGPPLLFERLWRQIGLDRLLVDLLRDRKFEFAVERAIFLTVLHRLVAPGSDRAAEKWKQDYSIAGADELALHHLYRAMAWLGEPLPKEQQTEAGARGPRTTKDLIEEELFGRRRDLFTSLDVVFFDTTSIYFEGEGGETLGRYGKSKDHRPDRKQMVVGLVLDNDGYPICCEMWPGNATDVKSLAPVVERLKKRFQVGQICVVADAGMISAEAIRGVEQRGWSYILGARLRVSKEVREKVLSHRGRYEEVHPPRSQSKDPSPLKVKPVEVEGRRYVVCLNLEQAEKDQRDRGAIVAALEDALNRGDKSLVGNKGYRLYLKAPAEGFTIDEEKVRREARYDGKWVLRTNTDLSASEVALKYKQLWMVEAMFRSMKSVLETRPIYHRRDETIRGHVFCSFLALVLRRELERRLADHGRQLEWADVIRDLDSLQEVELEVDSKRYLLRSETQGTAGKVFQACGVALP
ncbi:MAG: IS1634 family transposase, partial [bacterium]|nr:IS1634 family transposase [bacterium]